MRVMIVCLAGAMTSVAADAAAQGSVIDRAAWLAGCWELRAPGRVTTEMWMAPAGGAMFGASRTVVGSAVRESEYLRINARGDTLIYTAIPSGQTETQFKTTSTSTSPIVFENLVHDFPQRIIYRRAGADSVIARIEGPGPNNTTRGSDFPMRRVNCLTPPAPPPPAPPPDTLIMDAEFSPDGQQLLMVKGLGADWDMYISGPDGRGARKLANSTAVDYQPSWSPDGSRILFVSARDGHQEIYTVRPDGSDLVQLTRGTAHNSEPAWSPDGRSIAFRSERDRAGRPRIYVMNADGNGQRALTVDTAISSYPAWSPDGTRILFSSNRSGRSEVYVMNADGSSQRQVTTTPSADATVRHSSLGLWSPDGRSIVFWSTRDGNDEVYMMNADGSNPRNITNNPARDAPLGWTRDGQFILFRSTRDRTLNDIYRMRPDGTGVVRVTNTGSGD